MKKLKFILIMSLILASLTGCSSTPATPSAEETAYDQLMDYVIANGEKTEGQNQYILLSQNSTSESSSALVVADGKVSFMMMINGKLNTTVKLDLNKDSNNHNVTLDTSSSISKEKQTGTIDAKTFSSSNLQINNYSTTYIGLKSQTLALCIDILLKTTDESLTDSPVTLKDLGFENY